MREDDHENILQQLAADKIRFVRLQFMDIQGHLKDVSLPAVQCGKAFRDGIGFDGSSIDGSGRAGVPDLLLMPDPSTYTVIPWSPVQGREARFICDVRDYSGEPFVGDPRFILRKILRRAGKTGFEFFTGPEMEFWLFKASREKQGIQCHDRGSYFDLFPADNGVDIRRSIILALSDMGYTVEASHHEVSNSQHEISFRYGPALTSADRIVTFKYVARTIARQQGAIASFIPKPRANSNGNALHIHASLYKEGVNAFFDAEAPHGISDIAMKFIGGLLAHAKGLCRIANPTINSYKRLTPGFEAPHAVSWSTVNRSALVRVPAARGNATRIELRNPDAMSNPYLLLAGILAAGLDGIQKGLWPPESIGGNAYDLSRPGITRLPLENLPGDLAEAHACFLADSLLCDTVGGYFVDGFSRIAQTECESFRTAVHPWEMNRYLDAA